MQLRNLLGLLHKDNICGTGLRAFVLVSQVSQGSFFLELREQEELWVFILLIVVLWMKTGKQDL